MATLRAELHGDLAAITAMADGTAQVNKSPGSVVEPGLLSVVARSRNQRYLQALQARIPRVKNLA